MISASDWRVEAQAWFGGIHAEYQCYALVDMANIQADKRQVLATLHAHQAINILGDERPEAQQASAWLMPLDRDTLGQRQFDGSLRWASSSACVTWLCSTLPPNALAHALNERTKAVLPDNYQVLLRCYDPRVLPEIKTALSEEQSAVYWALDGQWAYVDRARTFQVVDLQSANQLASYEAPLVLTQRQTDQLLAAAEVDTVMPELMRESPEAFLAIPVAERVAFTKRSLQTADQLELEALADRVMFCVLTLELGVGFESSEQWTPVMNKVKNRQLTLLQAIKQVTRK